MAICEVEAKRPPKGWHIECNPKPIPPRCGVDWDYWHDDHNGDDDRLCGCAKSYDAALEAIEDRVRDEQAD